MSLDPIDYDKRQHDRYAAGRDLGADHARWWANVFAGHVSRERPLAVLDLGCGTGRFTGALADAFGGSVVGVEPSERMLEVAATSPRDGVRFAPGRAEAIPAPNASFDVVLMFLSFHHVRDRPLAAREVARVLRPGGRLLIRSQFSNRFADIPWHAYFPRAREIEMRMFPTEEEVEAPFREAGLRKLAMASATERFAGSLAEHAERLRHRAISTFEHMTQDDLREGFARLDAAVANEASPQPVVARSDFMMLEKPR